MDRQGYLICLCSRRPAGSSAKGRSIGLTRFARVTPVVGAALLVLGVALPAAAAELPAGVVLDATVNVVVVTPSFGGGPDTPVAGADVALAADVDDSPDNDPILVLHATTNTAGEATFSGVPRADAGGPAVHLALTATLESSGLDPSGCRTSHSWSGTALDVESPPAGPVVIKTSEASSVSCQVLSGRILDASGKPHRAASATASIIVANGGGAQAFQLDVASDGTFAQPIPSWGTAAAPATIRVEFVSKPTRAITSGGCVRSLGQAVTWTKDVTLQDGGSLDELALTTHEVVIDEQCDAISGGAALTAEPTLPPTDTIDRVAENATDQSATLSAAALVVLLSTLIGLAATGRRHRR